MNRYKQHLAGVSALALAASGSLGSATAEDVIFGGTVVSTCVLTVGAPGVLATSADSKLLSSKIAGGSSGTVNAVATGGGFSVTTTAPTEFTTAPGDGGSNVSFTSEYEITGDTNSGTKQAGESTPINQGTSTVTVDLEAQKDVGVYESGAYSATVTVTCE